MRRASSPVLRVSWLAFLTFGCLGAVGGVIQLALVFAHGGVAATYWDPQRIYVPREATRIVQANLEADTLRLVISSADPATAEAEVDLQIPSGSASLAIPLPTADARLATSTATITLFDGVFGGASIPFVSDADAVPLSHWTAGMLGREASLDIARAKRELESLALESEPSGLKRLTRIYDFLQGELDGHWGNPAAFASSTPGLRLLDLVRASGTGVDCHPSSVILAAYATLGGIPTRVVSLMGEQGGLPVGRHTITESWLSDQQRWVMSDMMNGVHFFESPAGDPVNILEAIELWNTAGRAGLSASLVDRAAEDPYFVPRHYFSRSVLIYFVRPVHYLGSSVEKLWATVWQPKASWTYNSSELRTLTLVHAASRMILFSSVIGAVLCVISFMSGALLRSCRSRN